MANTKNKKTAQNNSLIKDVDIAIVGAGIVGQSFALAIAESGLSIAIIDAQNDVTPKAEKPDEFSPRVSAISLASQASLVNIGAWQAIQRKQVYTSMQVWEAQAFGKISFSAADIGLNSLGHIIENEQLCYALYQAAQAHENIEYLLGEQIEQMQYADKDYQIQLSNKQMLTAKLLVGADGANSFVRNTLGFKQTFWDYDHTAIVANVRTEHPHEGIARQAFSPSGPLAFLPLPDPQQSSIVWSQDTEQANELLALDDEAFCKALGVAIDMQQGLCELSTKRFHYPLRMRYCRQWVDESVALIGDAAHTIHPLAGQGANLGIGDAVALAHNIKQSLDSGKDFYAKQALRKYERFRKAEAQKTIATMEGFKRLFAGDDPLKTLVRNIGLNAADRLNPVKAFFIKQAEG